MDKFRNVFIHLSTGQSRYNASGGVHRTVIASAMTDQAARCLQQSVLVGKHLYLGVFWEYLNKKWHFSWIIYINKKINTNIMCFIIPFPLNNLLCNKIPIFITHEGKFEEATSAYLILLLLISIFRTCKRLVTLRYWDSRLSCSPWPRFYIHFMNILCSMTVCFLFKNKHCLDWIFFYWPPTSHSSDWLIHHIGWLIFNYATCVTL